MENEARDLSEAIESVEIFDPLKERTAKIYAADLNELCWIIDFLIEKHTDMMVVYHVISAYLRGRGMAQSKKRLEYASLVAVDILKLSTKDGGFPEVAKLIRLTIFKGKNSKKHPEKSQG